MHSCNFATCKKQGQVVQTPFESHCQARKTQLARVPAGGRGIGKRLEGSGRGSIALDQRPQVEVGRVVGFHTRAVMPGLPGLAKVKRQLSFRLIDLGVVWGVL